MFPAPCRGGLRARGIAFRPDGDPLDQAVAVSVAHGFHPVYDALHVALALREGVPLATMDRRLADFAGRVGVALWNP